jgi:hypothetical protein
VCGPRERGRRGQAARHIDIGLGQAEFHTQEPASVNLPAGSAIQDRPE